MKRLLLLCALAALVLFVLLSRTSCETSDAVGSADLEPAEATPTASAPPRVSFPTRTPRVTYLPDTLAVYEFIQVHSQSWKHFRSDLEFKIGFELYLKTCMKGVEIAPDTMIDYIFRLYRLEEGSDEFVVTLDRDPLNASMRAVQVTDEQWQRFDECSGAYLESHTWDGAGYSNETVTWGSGTLFPIGSQDVYGALEQLGVEIPGL